MNYSYLVLNDKFDFESSARVIEVPTSPIKRLFHYFIYIWKNKIDCVEVYDTGLLTFFYSLFAFLIRKKVIIFIIGMELLPVERGESKISIKRRFKRLGFFLSLKLADKIIFKELHMLEYLDKWNLSHKVHHLHNAVPILALPKLELKNIDVIYVNTVRKMRYPLLFLGALSILKDKGIFLNCKMMGFHSLQSNAQVPDRTAEEDALKYIEKYDLSDCVEVMPFRTDALEYIKRSKIFVLPSDVIYANYSLLESMASSCVPIVTEGDGAAKVVDNGVSGFVCAFDSQDIANRISTLLQDKKTLLRLSEGARNKIIKEFSIEVWAKTLFNIYNQE
ncbi:glycosyltransferase [Suttonella sp. R2A3]|uniref:glycosyltransferase n=1 Tax=Suttonella sp. R2A3 TaxID=2908648 RepID=UPI001F2B939B|nr:glycosyltransferase [Suttonella sp. R2A3]UJF25314.1 glycosyltransferase [Suttonella sp. R2A3]